MTLKTQVVSPFSADDLTRVYRLRHDIYINEMQLPLDCPGEELFDPIDDYSTNILLTDGDRDVGTVRTTFLQDGPLEIQDQCPAWSDYIYRTVGTETSNIAEVTRLMVRRECRGGAATIRLLAAALDEFRARECEAIFFAGKIGPLSRLYRRFGGKVVVEEPLPYVLDGYKLGDYVLMRFDPQQIDTLIARNLKQQSSEAQAAA